MSQSTATDAARAPIRQKAPRGHKHERRIALAALATIIENAQDGIACALRHADFLINDYHPADEVHRAVAVLRDLPHWRDLVAELHELDDELEVLAALVGEPT